MGTVEMLIALGLVVAAAIWIIAASWPLPPTTPALPPRRAKAELDALLTVPAWRKRQAQAVAYERPLDVANPAGQLPDNGVLQPPRDVAGLNGEA